MLEKKGKENSFTFFLFHFRLCIFSLYVPYSLSLSLSLSLYIGESEHLAKKRQGRKRRSFLGSKRRSPLPQAQRGDAAAEAENLDTILG